MIDKMSNEDLLDMLMTSDFSEDYKPEELKEMLFKFRNFYRILHGKSQIKNDGKDSKIRKLEEKIEDIERELLDTKVKYAKNKDYLHEIQNKKLSLSERLKGKLKLKTKN